MSSKYVMVEAISQFRMRYVVEVPEDCENPTDPSLYPCTPEEYAMDTVTCEEAKEFTQHHLGETIVSAREVTLNEAIVQYRKDEPFFSSWEDDVIIKNAITPIGHSEKERIAKEESLWNKLD
jgi:hypothetical protein